MKWPDVAMLAFAFAVIVASLRWAGWSWGWTLLLAVVFATAAWLIGKMAAP